MANKNVITMLQTIATGQKTHISKEDGMPLLKQGLVTVDTENLASNGDAAVALTEAGKAMVANAGAPKSNGPVVTSPYNVIRNAVLPPSKRGFAKGGGAPTQYPFETMEIGDSFFVPVSEKHPDPVKTLGSTVSSANNRFAEKTGETKQVVRAKRGPKNKAVYGPDGKKIMETVTVDVLKYTRRFSLRPVKNGQSYGEWVAPADGVLIARVNVKD